MLMRMLFVATMLVFLFTPGITGKHLCNCTKGYDPVCGVDGKTYRNMCELQCAHVGLDYKGRCKYRPGK